MNADRMASADAPLVESASLLLALSMASFGRAEDAVRSLEAASRGEVAARDALLNLGAVLRMNDMPGAELALSRAYRIDPLHLPTIYNLGLRLHDAGDMSAAAPYFEQAAQAGKMVAGALYALGVRHGLQGDFRVGLEYLIRAAGSDPRQLGAIGERASHILRQWSSWDCDTLPEYARWFFRPCYRAARFDQPHWDGRAIPERRLVIYMDGGLGDTVQMLRFLPAIRRRARCRTLLLCRPELLTLVSGSGLLKSRDGSITEVVSESEEISENDDDTRLNLLAAPLVLRPTTRILSAGRPYLRAAASAAFDAYFQGTAPCPLRVGIRWSGNPNYGLDHERSCAPDDLIPLLAFDAEFHSLQLGSIAPGFQDWSASLHDLADTAALIRNMDLIISVDTGVAHVAAAMGKPVWLLLGRRHDARWRGVTAAPWYPAVKVYRREERTGEVLTWRQLLQIVARDLEGLHAERGVAAFAKGGR